MKAAEHTFCFLTVVAESLSLCLQTQAARQGMPPAPSPCVWLMRSDLSDSRNPSANFIRSIFPANPSKCLFGELGDFSVAYGNSSIHTSGPLVPPTPLPLWSASKWHSCLAAFITVLWWMSRPHLHNTSEIWGEQMEGKLQELSMSTTWLFLTRTCRQPHIEVCLNILFLLVGVFAVVLFAEDKIQSNPNQRRLIKRCRCIKEGEHLSPSSSRALRTVKKAKLSSFLKPWSQDS